jgi:hypothetical protein
MNKHQHDSRSPHHDDESIANTNHRQVWRPPQLVKLGGSAKVAGKVKTNTNPNEGVSKNGEKGPVSPS